MTQATMRNFEEFYVLGLPIETEIGLAHFLKVREFPEFLGDLQIVSMSIMEFQNEYRKVNKDGQWDEQIAEMDNWEIFELFFHREEIARAYKRIFVKVFRDETVMERLTRENFGYYREMVMRMNVQTEEDINPNPEIQRALERSKRVKNTGDPITISTICSSIVSNSSATYSELLDWTIFQLYLTFQRIGHFKNYDTSTLFATVPTDKPVEIEEWSKQIDLFEKESHTMDGDKFKQVASNVTG